MICKRIREMTASNPEGGPPIVYPIGSLVDGKDVGRETVMLLCTHPLRYAIPHDDECRDALKHIMESTFWKRAMDGVKQMEAKPVFDSLSDAEKRRVRAYIEGGYVKSTHSGTATAKQVEVPPDNAVSDVSKSSTTTKGDK